MVETNECLEKAEMKVERKTEDTVKPAKTVYPFAWMDSTEVCMVATQSMVVDALVRLDAFSEKPEFAFAKEANPNIDLRFDEKDARSTFALEYLVQMLQLAKKCGAKQVTLTLRTDFLLRMEFEGRDTTALHDQTLRTALIISPIVDEGRIRH